MEDCAEAQPTAVLATAVFLALEVPYPPFDEQRRIAGILDQR